MSRRLSGRHVCVCLYICECDRVIISVFFNLVPCVQLNLQTVFTHPQCQLLFSLMTHSIYLFFPLFNVSQTNILFSLCQSFSSFETILRHCIRRSEGAAEGIRGHTVHSLLLAFISIHIRQERCPQHLVCNFRRGCAFQNTLSVLSEEMKRFIITVRK